MQINQQNKEFNIEVVQVMAVVLFYRNARTRGLIMQIWPR
jgi:hypothetical protein